MAESGRELAKRIYRTALDGADPAAAVRRALDFTPDTVIALGKAAETMAGAAPVSRSLIIGPDDGDHPVPGSRSYAAAKRIEQFASQVDPAAHVLVLLSGGTSSLAAAPVRGIQQEDLSRLFQLLLTSGLDIHTMNLVRKRFCRFAGGRLATALPGRSLTVYAVSDVAGDQIEDIGSGPCAPDPTTVAEYVALVRSHGLWDRIPVAMKQSIPETPKPGEPAFQRVRHLVVANNQTALDAAGEAAEQLGFEIQQFAELRGSAADAGHRIAHEVSHFRAPSCLLAGGETTVTIHHHGGLGGRCQELALAAALELEKLGAHNITILAAGTDGRDGPTDAAGAVVDSKTPDLIRAAGLDPVRHLERHDAYPALESAHCLLITGPTGTNVRDVVVALRM